MTILFTRAWEDDRLDLELLSSPGQEILVVAAAGDAALALAARGSRVVAVDTNPDQLALVKLKLAAACVLDDAALYRWFEVGADPAAPALFREAVRPLLSQATAEFWDRHIAKPAPVVVRPEASADEVRRRQVHKPRWRIAA